MSLLRLMLAAVLGVFAIGALVGFGIGRASAQEHAIHHGHAEFHDVYKEWMMPTNPAMPCCNAKYDHHNNLINGGDCYATVAETRASATDPEKLAWWARRDDGEWVEIPRTRIVNELNPDDTGTRAHLCENFQQGGGVLCFLPPVGGS